MTKLKCPYCGKSRDNLNAFYARGTVRRITYSDEPFEKITLEASWIVKCKLCNRFFITTD